MNQTTLPIAIQNNALWCDLISRMHDAEGEFFDSFWINHHDVPQLYPHFITLEPIAQDSQSLEELYSFINERNDRSIAIKDSYCELRLEQWNMKKIIQAEWIWLALEKSKVAPQNLWKKVTAKKELAMWTEAWSDGDGDLKGTFPSSLLEEGDVYFLGEFKNSQILKGAIVFQTDDSIGVSNVFSKNSLDLLFWQELIENIRFNFPDTLLVGYEFGNSLIHARNAGFQSCGELAVWTR